MTGHLFLMIIISLISIALIALHTAIKNIVVGESNYHFGATIVVVVTTLATWIGAYFNFLFNSYSPITITWPPILIPGAILLDVILLLSRSYLVVATLGGLSWGVMFYWENFPVLSAAIQRVEYGGTIMSIAELMRYNYLISDASKYVYIFEEGSLALKTFWSLMLGGISSFVYIASFNIGKSVNRTIFSKNIFNEYLTNAKTEDSMAINKVTKIMMAAANLDNGKLYRAFEERNKSPFKADPLEYGVDTNKVYEEARQAKYRVNSKNIVILITTFFGFIAIYNYIDKLDYYSVYGEDNSGWWHLIIPFLVIAGTDFLSQRVATARARYILYKNHDDVSCDLAENDQAQNVVISGGYSPFLGSGFEVSGWSFTVDTQKPDDESKEIIDVDLIELYAETVKDIEKLNLDSIIIKDEIFIDGRDVREVAHQIQDILPNGDYDKPKVELPLSAIKNYIGKNDNTARHYKVLRVSLWDGQIILSTFIRYVKKAETLFVETRVFMLPPLKQEYLKYESTPPTPIPFESIRNAATCIFKSIFVWMPVIWQAFLFVQDGLFDIFKNHEKANKKEIRDNKYYNYGWGNSLREQWSLGSNYERYFQMIDKDFYTKMIKEAILSSLLRSLEKRNISVEDFKQASTRIFNEGVIVTGGNVSAESIAAGQGASSSVKKIFDANKISGQKTDQK